MVYILICIGILALGIFYIVIVHSAKYQSKKEDTKNISVTKQILNNDQNDKINSPSTTNTNISEINTYSYPNAVSSSKHQTNITICDVISDTNINNTEGNKVPHTITNTIKQVGTTSNDTSIIWTKELKRIKSIMLLTLKNDKDLSIHPINNPNNNETSYTSKDKFTEQELYELAKQFASFIDTANNLRYQNKLSQEHEHCLTTIKWCIKHCLSVIYWQNRLNQVNSLLGLSKTVLNNKYLSKNNTDRKFLSASDKNELIKRTKEQFEKEYTFYHIRHNILKEQQIVQKAIKWADETNQMYYKQKWVNRIIFPPSEDALTITKHHEPKSPNRIYHPEIAIRNGKTYEKVNIDTHIKAGVKK